jgi:hypothetical protein
MMNGVIKNNTSVLPLFFITFYLYLYLWLYLGEIAAIYVSYGQYVFMQYWRGLCGPMSRAQTTHRLHSGDSSGAAAPALPAVAAVALALAADVAGDAAGA